MTFRSYSKYLAFARAEAARARVERAELFGRALYFPLVLGVFSALWRAVGDAGMPLAQSPKTMVWYLAISEWVLMSSPPIFLEIEQEVRRGDIAYHLSRPSSYLLSSFARGLGAIWLRSPFLALVAFVCALGYTRELPPEPSALGYALLLGVFAQIVLFSFTLSIGLTAFWLQSTAPVYWVWQKSAFVLGGLMLPLELYPALVQRIARFTPFPCLLYGPARFALGAPAGHAFELTLGLAGWFCVACLLASCIHARALRALTVNGG